MARSIQTTNKREHFYFTFKIIKSEQVIFFGVFLGKVKFSPREKEILPQNTSV